MIYYYRSFYHYFSSERITLMTNKAYLSRTYEKFENILNFYAANIFKTVDRVDKVYALKTQDHLRLPPDYSQMDEIVPDTAWGGGEYRNMWLRFEYTVPDELDGKQLCVIPDVNAVEILCFKNGKPSGIINSKNKFIGGDHSVMFVSQKASAGEKFDIALECYAGHSCLGCSPLENYMADEETFRNNNNRTYTGIRIVALDKLISDLVFDLMTVIQMAKLPDDNYLAMKANDALLAAYPEMIFDIKYASDEEIHESAEKVRKLLSPALEKGKSDASRGKIGVIGHSHMDTAWLWPMSETIRKCARTYSQALTLMDMYPEYNFIQSSALHLDWMREYYPDIFEGIKVRVAEGRYEPNGGVWVECDCNITGGEAMVRQFLFGQRFTEKYLGYRSDSFWLPDTFGYNAAIPQIMQQSGVKYFYTTKIGWCDLNKFPTESFVWRGVDGSEVLTHFNRTHFTPDVKSLYTMCSETADHHNTDMRLAAYGYGDGGGGPTYGMCELLNRARDIEGMPAVKPMSISNFMHELEKRRDKLPVYDGELYLELHRGTLTQMHEIKKNNRKAEIALHNLELLNVLSNEKVNEKLDFLDFLYKELLKNQFHDILPGTSIPKVYEVCIPEMRNVIKAANEETMKYADKMSKKSDDKLSIYNQLSFERNDVTVIDGEYGFSGKAYQIYTDMDGNKKTAVKAVIPAMSSVTLDICAPTEMKSEFEADGNILITPFYRVEFDENGYISSLYDIQADREIRKEGGEPLGTFWTGEDMPINWDNWDIDDDAFLKLKPIKYLVSREVISDGAVEYRIRSEYKFGRKSSIVVDTVFYAGSRQIDFEAKVDWQERHTLLKAGFDVSIRSSTVKNEIQFGHIDRPTTRNTSLEASKFEICNHKWSDLSETHYGVAILNDCKYGISVEESNMRLTLDKGGCRPDPFTNVGVHTMTYSLLPHIGAFDAENVIHPAYELNYKAIPVSGKLDVPTLFEISNPGIICETVKSAEDVPGAYVIRLYESERNHSNCKISFNGAKKVWSTNMLEEKSEEITLDNGVALLKFRPFEIKTILVER